QWWLVTTRPSGETKEAVQKPRPTTAPRGYSVSCARSPGSRSRPRALSWTSRSGSWAGCHMPSSARAAADRASARQSRPVFGRMGRVPEEWDGIQGKRIMAVIPASRRSGGAQRFLQHDEIQVVAARDAEAFVAVGKRMRFAAAPEAAPPVPCDQAVAQPDDLHAQAAAAEDLARKALGLGQDAVANPPALPARVDGKQAEPGSAAIAFQVAAAQQGAAGLLGQQDALPFAEHGQDAFTVGPLAIEEVGLGGPAGPAGLAAVGGLREGDDGVRVGRRGP